MVLTACQWSGDGRTPGYLHLRLNTNPTTLDPALIVDVTGGSIAAKIFNGLVRFNEDLDIIPDVAESWTISPDGRSYTFRLRKDITFSMGREVTAHDVRYSFERVLKPSTKSAITWVLDRIEGAGDIMAGKTEHASGIRVVDDHTLVIRLEKPFSPFLSLLGMTTAYIVPREVVERLGQDFGSHPVGSGPYILQEWKHGQNITLVSRPDYWGGKPRMNGILYRVIPEDLTAVVEFETGRLDVLQITAAEYQRFTTDPTWRNRVVGRPGLNCFYLGLNCSRPPFDDARVRRAANMAIDRKRILDTIYEKRGILAAGPVPPTLWRFDSVPDGSEGYPYDPEMARQLIRTAGQEGARITIYLSAEPEVLDIVEVIQYYLKQAGLIAEIVQLDWSAFKEAVNLGNADAFWLSWWADYPDPENFLYPLFHSANAGPPGNRTWYRNPEFDRLIETAQRTGNRTKRYRLYREAEELIKQDAPWVFMWHRSDFFVVQPRVTDFRIYPVYSIDKGMDIAVSK
jgi:peptide/nickel transport system substrate-binding protein/oligopeptide transport system substrate-binding protein